MMKVVVASILLVGAVFSGVNSVHENIVNDFDVHCEESISIEKAIKVNEFNEELSNRVEEMQQNGSETIYVFINK